MKGRMPSGVMSPRMAAAMVDAKNKRPVMKDVTWDARTKKKILERKGLMDRARAGDQKAVKQLWQEYRCRIYREPECAPGS